MLCCLGFFFFFSSSFETFRDYINHFLGSYTLQTYLQSLPKCNPCENMQWAGINTAIILTSQTHASLNRGQFSPTYKLSTKSYLALKSEEYRESSKTLFTISNLHMMLVHQWTLLFGIQIKAKYPFLIFQMSGSQLSWISVTFPKHPVLHKSQTATDDNIHISHGRHGKQPPPP